MALRIIGDVHGQVDFVLKPPARTYLDLISECDHSIQIGDMGDAETYAELTTRVDPTHHRFFGGNHDHYHDLPVHSLGDYGRVQLGGIELFFVRGARSSDKQKLVNRGQQLGRKLWYEEEELPESEHDAILEAYLECQPRLVLSHTCPAHILPFIYEFVKQRSRYAVAGHGQSSPTNELLERLFEAHQPDTWCFGHYHHDWHYHEDGTDFRCVGELCFIDVP